MKSLYNQIVIKVALKYLFEYQLIHLLFIYSSTPSFPPASDNSFLKNRTVGQC